MIILIVRYIIPTVNLIYAVFLFFSCWTFSDKHGRILILEALIDDTEFILINLYSANTKDDQLTTFSEPTNLLENFELT